MYHNENHGRSRPILSWQPKDQPGNWLIWFSNGSVLVLCHAWSFGHSSGTTDLNLQKHENETSRYEHHRIGAGIVATPSLLCSGAKVWQPGETTKATRTSMIETKCSRAPTSTKKTRAFAYQLLPKSFPSPMTSVSII